MERRRRQIYLLADGFSFSDGRDAHPATDMSCGNSDDRIAGGLWPACELVPKTRLRDPAACNSALN